MMKAIVEMDNLKRVFDNVLSGHFPQIRDDEGISKSGKGRDGRLFGTITVSAGAIQWAFRLDEDDSGSVLFVNHHIWDYVASWFGDEMSKKLLLDWFHDEIWPLPSETRLDLNWGR